MGGQEHGHGGSGGALRRGIRVLVLCADIGEGHVTAARALVGELARHEEVEAVELRTSLDVMGRRFGAFMTRGFHVHLDEASWTYELAYRFFFERTLPRHAAEWALALLGGRGLIRTITSAAADVVVTEFPVLSAALGMLRSHGRLSTPVCSSISDPAGLYYWAHPGIDLHLLSWPESLPEAVRIAGSPRAVVVRPLVDQRFFGASNRDPARAGLSFAEDRPVILVSGGGWGMGDLAGAVEVVVSSVAAGRVVCLAGRNETLRERLTRRYGTDPRVRVLGFIDEMPTLLAAADAIIHTTGGTTALEARVVGCPLIAYGSGVAHVRAHARALAAFGLAEWARDRGALGPALVRSLAKPRPAPLPLVGLPEAADVVVGVARRTGLP